MSLRDSKDAIEQLYGSDVLKHFPNYEVFWRKFIGNPNAERIEPYRYNFLSKMSPQEEDRILKNYEKVQMAHYSLFCHLAGAHFQLKELENTENINDPKENYFRHWEHFEVAYMHLGSTFYVLESLWNTVLKLRRYPANLRHLEGYLNSKGKNALFKKLDDVMTSVKVRRDLPVHYGRIFARRYKGKFYVPLKVKKDMMWSQGTETQEWRESDKQLRNDIARTEKMINDLHQVLISEYEDFIKEKNIQIVR